LYLYLLSLRDDLSNENIQLIALIMKNCFPAMEVRTRLGGASLEEYGEIARAWKNAEERTRALEISLGSGAERRRPRAFDRDSASFFLDRYFSDEALAETRAAARAAPAAPARKIPPRTPPLKTVAPASAPAPVPPSRRGEKARGTPVPTERQTRSVKRTPQMGGRPLLRFAPVAFAAVVVASAALLVRFPVPLFAVQPTAQVPQPLPQTSAPLPRPPAPATPATKSYVVMPGDSLWKIFRAKSPGSADRKGWLDFLDRARSLNGLGDPDQLVPGKVLTLSGQE
jgi:nucleoid-associated protein YgaU